MSSSHASINGAVSDLRSVHPNAVGLHQPHLAAPQVIHLSFQSVQSAQKCNCKVLPGHKEKNMKRVLAYVSDPGRMRNCHVNAVLHRLTDKLTNRQTLHLSMRSSTGTTTTVLLLDTGSLTADPSIPVYLVIEQATSLFHGFGLTVWKLTMCKGQ
jgi:hypothetical protein